MERHPLAIRHLDTREVAVSELRLYEGNARQGDIGAIAASLQRLGQYRAIVVNAGTLTGRPLEVLAGNHTVQAAQALEWDTLLAHIVDVDEDHARRIVLVDNRTNDLATNDTAALLALLQQLGDDYSGTGYDGDDVDDLLESMTQADLDSLNDDDRAPTTGELLALVDVTFGEPSMLPELGSRWRLGRHVLVVARLADQHAAWSPLLAGRLFMPYPDPYLYLGTVADEHDLLLVQPNRFLAGHLLDKWNGLHPDDQAVAL